MNAVLFDLDETLLDRTSSLRDFVLWQAQGMLQNSLENERSFCQRFIELDANGSVWKDKVYSKLINEFGITDWTMEELLQSYESCFSGFAKPMPGANDAVSRLHGAGYKLGLVSNGKSPFQERNFIALGISELFGSVIVSDAVGCRKPERRIFEIACESLGALPNNTVFVGDNPIADIDGANAVGMYTVYVPGYVGDTCEHANAICNDFSELTGIVEKAFI